MFSAALTRRRFLQGTALAGAAAWSDSRALSQEVGGKDTSANERLRVAIIGMGVRGREHLNALLGMDEVEVTAVADVDERHRLHGCRWVEEVTGKRGVQSHEDFREMIAAEVADAVVIAVPNHWHALMAIACAENGIDIYGEVPLAHSIVEGRAICRAVERFGRVWQTGNQLRSDPIFQRACGLVAGGRLGVVRSVEIGNRGGVVDLTGAAKNGFFQSAAGLNYDLWLGPAPWLPYHPGRVHENWRWHQAFGGGRLMSWVGKYVDIALWSLGLDRGGPQRVEAFGTLVENSIYDCLTSYDIEARYYGGLDMEVSSSLAPGIRWHGDAGWIYVNEAGIRASSPDLLEGDGESEWAMERFARYGRDHYRDFLTAIRTRRPTIAPCESAQRAATIGHLGLLSIGVGRAITWKDDEEVVTEDRAANERLETPYREPWILQD